LNQRDTNGIILKALGRSLGKTSGSPPMAGGILPGFLLSEVRKVILLVSDESGDLGLKGSRCYIVLTLLLRSEHDAHCIMDIANALSQKHFRNPLRKWNNMKSKHKNAPQTLAAFLADLLPKSSSKWDFHFAPSQWSWTKR
jgi:hypothetical protein